MPLSFRDLLDAEAVAPVAVRLLRHKDSRASRGRSPYELWRDDRPAFDWYQRTQSPQNESKLAGGYWASFVVTPQDETLFVGLYQVGGHALLGRDTPKVHMEGIDEAGSLHVYDLALDERLHDLAGRLIIDWGSGERAWIQRADKQDKAIVELRKEFQEPAFPGFLNLLEPLSKLNKLPKSWIAVLRSAKGVYLLTCPKTKEQYVGSATGDQGFFQRWSDYARDGHGGDVALKSREPSDYQVSILEVAGSSAADHEILEMEERWKRKLQSRGMGLNRN